MRKNIITKTHCVVLLIGLATLQFMHSLYFTEQVQLLEFRAYGFLLTLIPPSFYFFSRAILSGNPSENRFTQFDIVHCLAPILALFLPVHILPVVAFVFGTGYTLWFTRVIVKLRGHTNRFKFELFFFAMFAVMALGALILGLFLPTLDPRIFYTAYANSISASLLLILSALLFFPQLLSDILLVSELAYAKSRLGGIDTEFKLKELDKLVVLDKQYQNEELSLASLADLVELTPHQLSELINSHYGYGFPRYIREQRVKEAKRLLIADSKTSILSISMETGFRSQSNFYTAFKEIAGMSPGQYRKNS
jgi:AraC-like DNA-binding protein